MFVLNKCISSWLCRIHILDQNDFLYCSVGLEFSSKLGLRCVIVLKIKNFVIICTVVIAKSSLTTRATKSVLKGSSVTDSIVFGSQIAISRSSLYATCSAFSRRRRSILSSFVSTLVGGGVSFGSCNMKWGTLKQTSRKKCGHENLPQNDLERLQRRHILGSSSREVAYQAVVSKESNLGPQKEPINLEVKTASLVAVLALFPLISPNT